MDLKGSKDQEHIMIAFSQNLTGRALVLAAFLTVGGSSLAAEFIYDEQALPGKKPWTSVGFENDPESFQFVVIGDRTGGANQEETFRLAVAQLNLLRPEFVINVGDLIEGYSDDSAELNAEWQETDEMLAELEMPFFRTPGNHDIANDTAAGVWADRYGAAYYHFRYQDVLFLVLNSEDPPREAPEGIREKLELYNELQVSDPARAQAMLAEFMADESVVAGLSKPVDFSAEQLEYVRETLADNEDARWTFVFVHEPAWENASDSFTAIQGMLADRKHTVVAGHLHYYDYDLIDGHEHITMGPAGASFHHEGPGNVDHVMWVTMTEEGPEIANIALKGVFDRKGLDPSLFGAYDRKGAE
jgi:metallophosphoesterase superfamily enzyme